MRKMNRLCSVAVAVTAILLLLSPLAQADDEQPTAPTPEVTETKGTDKALGATLDLTFMSKLLDKGGEYYSEKSATLGTVDLDLWGTGFGLAIGRRRPNSSGDNFRERTDFVVYYKNQLFAEEPYATDYKVCWVYHEHSDQSRTNSDGYEGVISLAWHELLPGGLCPFYTVAYETPKGSGWDNRGTAGWWHLFGLTYDIKLSDAPGLTDLAGVPGQPGIPVVSELCRVAGAQTLRLSADVAYRDGLGGTDHDWSHATFGVSTGVTITEQITVTPGMFYQISMEDDVNERDDFYGMVSTTIRF